MAMTLDGRVMRPDGKWYGLTSAGDRHRMDLYRQEADVVIVGRESVIADDPVVLPKHLHPGRSAPTPTMICRSALPPVDRKMFRQTTARPLLCISGSLQDQLGELANVADVELFEEPTPSDVLSRLYGRGVRHVLLEGGPRLNWAFFQADLVDVLYLTLVPFLIGQRDLPTIVDGPVAFPDFDQRVWEPHRAHTIGREIFFEYRRIRDDVSR